MRDRSSFQSIVKNATFLALAVFIHVVVILGNRPLADVMGELSGATEQRAP